LYSPQANGTGLVVAVADPANTWEALIVWIDVKVTESVISYWFVRRMEVMTTGKYATAVISAEGGRATLAFRGPTPRHLGMLAEEKSVMSRGMRTDQSLNP